MTDTQLALASYTGKKVKLLIDKPGEERREAIGRVDIANELAMILKEVGQVMTTLIEASWIVPDSIEEVPDTPREIRSRRLDPLSLSNARHHLIERHGWPLKSGMVNGVHWLRGINEMTDQEAQDAHSSLDHSLLGHYHQSRETLATEVQKQVSDES